MTDPKGRAARHEGKSLCRARRPTLSHEPAPLGSATAESANLIITESLIRLPSMPFIREASHVSGLTGNLAAPVNPSFACATRASGPVRAPAPALRNLTLTRRLVSVNDASPRGTAYVGSACSNNGAA